MNRHASGTKIRVYTWPTGPQLGHAEPKMHVDTYFCINNSLEIFDFYSTSANNIETIYFWDPGCSKANHVDVQLY
jgi:hypothetical protein